ncbi:MAG: hypothetical protein IKO25_01235 [Clostridia bacterium]|nr:hypothetical protein [Clostridia bacterium]
MKTIQELYDEVSGNEELRARFIEAAGAGKQEAFLKEHGCEATLEEVAAFLKAKAEEDAPLSMDELENTAGGKCSRQSAGEVVMSVFTAGVVCGITAIVSASVGEYHVGRKKDEEGYLCEHN